MFSKKRIARGVIPHLLYIKRELGLFFTFFFLSYLKGKVIIFSRAFETHKNILVRAVLLKRGRANRLFLHLMAMVLLAVGLLVSPLVSDSPLFSQQQNALLSFAQGIEEESVSLSQEEVFETQLSDKPRSEIITYLVEKGDTISTIGKKFGVSGDTIKWANELKNDNLNIGDSLKILPVTGIAHKVERGESVYSIAKKYAVNPQEIVDFTFNDFANPQTFSLVQGQILIVPNGVKPQEKPRYVRRTYIATGPVSITDAGFTWPLQGTINQLYSWYHKGTDIGAQVGSAVVAAQSGKVSEVYSGGWNGGYGVHVIIHGENGYTTLYAHLSGTNVSPGDTVTAGQTVIGWVGLSGRTTGPHLHFEIRGSNGLLNPLSFLR